MKKSIRLLALAGVMAIAVPASAAPVVTNVNADLSAAPFTFSYMGATFTFGASGDIFNPLTVQTGGTGQISSFGGFLGIPVSPTSSFTDRGTVTYGPGSGNFSPFPSSTVVPFSNGKNFLGLLANAGGQNYYGYAFTTNTMLNTFAFETVPGQAITASVAAAVPEPATWALMMIGFGAVGFAMRRHAKVTTRVRFA